MMASRILSRFLPGAEEGRLERHADPLPFEARLEAGRYARSTEPFRDELEDEELDNMLLEAGADSVADADEQRLRANTSPTAHINNARKSRNGTSRPRGCPEDDDEIPASLLLEHTRMNAMDQHQDESYKHIPKPSDTEDPWGRPRSQQKLPHDGHLLPGPINRERHHTPASTRTRIDPKEQATYRWINVRNVDGFLLEVHQYFMDHGIWSICLSRVFYLLTTAFLFSMYMFLSTCVDIAKIPDSKSTSEVLIPSCMKKTSFVKNVMLWIFVFWWLSTAFRYTMDYRRLWHLHQFYHYLLGIHDTEIQTIPWERVVEGLMDLREINPETAEGVSRAVRKSSQSKQRMDACDIAHRLMRRDNYYIALINREVLDLSLPVPFLGTQTFYSKSLEWCIGFCFENFIFDEQGHVQKTCLDAKNRQRMIQALQRRLRFAAIISVFMAPFNIGAHCIYFFSRYYAEFRNSPARLGARAFTPLAEWKMREFNELEHEFRRRIKMAYPFADRYLSQFPKDKTNQAMNFVSLVTGTIAAILGIATLLDPELFLGFEVTPGRTAFFYISICMGIFAAARGAVPDDTEVHEPVLHLLEVMEYTHYCPQRWRKQLHSNNVRTEFSALYQMRILIFAQELLSLIVAPFILWRNSGSQSKHIIDFFRQNTLNVNGLGDLCSHAVFDFQKRKNVEDDDAGRDAAGLREEYFGVKDEKMIQSQYYFMQRLGKYDQQHPSRHQRQSHTNVQPPIFPPLSPLRDAANNRKTHREPAVTEQRNGQLRSPSPQQSILLDLQHKRQPASSRKPQFAARPTQQHEAVKPQQQAIDDAPHADLTTSRLIEQDHELADSWKSLRDDELGSAGHSREADKPRNNGVLGLLVAFSKAQADGKGNKMGGNFG